MRRPTEVDQTRVTVRVPLEESQDLLERPARACLGFVVDDRPRVEPIVIRHPEGRYLVGIPEDRPRPEPGSEVVVLVDDGVMFFELRAVYVRGRVTGPDPMPEDGLVWLRVEPSRTSSWDYGRMRVDDAPRRP